MDTLAVRGGNGHTRPPPYPPRKRNKPIPQGMPPILLAHPLMQGVLTVEDNLDSRRAQSSIAARVRAIADRLANMPEPYDDTTSCHIDCTVHQPLLSVSLFDFLIERNQLPEFEGGKRIKYQLASNQLVVHVVPSFCHHSAAGSFASDLFRWSESGGVIDCLEMGLGGATTLHYRSELRQPGSTIAVPRSLRTTHSHRLTFRVPLERQSGQPMSYTRISVLKSQSHTSVGPAISRCG